MKEHAGEMSDEDKATDRWENEGGHTAHLRGAIEYERPTKWFSRLLGRFFGRAYAKCVHPANGAGRPVLLRNVSSVSEKTEFKD